MNQRWSDKRLEEEEFHQPEDRKESRGDRKRAVSQDRSKYKKTDQKKIKETPQKSHEHLLKGRVITIVPQGIIVAYEDKTYSCVLRGLLKKEKTMVKNLVTVGDFVLFEPTSQGEGVIAKVEPRFSTLSRADNLSRKKEQLIASNVDQVLITGSVVMPPLKPALIDRYIIAAHKGGMEPIIIINKMDLFAEAGEEEKALLQEFFQAYRKMGLKVIPLSIITGEGLTELQAVMQNKVSVFSGPSGVGKSSLINAVTGLDLRVGKTVEKTKKGAHTTSYSHLIPLSFGGWCVDTPGIKSFGLWDLKLEEVESYYAEIHEIGLQCKFPDCSHSHEKNCAVLEAVEQGKIFPMRYQSYEQLRESILSQHLRR